MSQREIDVRNIEFWNELCGSSLARSLGINELSTDNLRRFDGVYFALYPYLPGYVLNEDLHKKKVLEIGPGYGTLGQFLASRGSDYYSLDVAEGPIEMMCYRLHQMGREWRGKVQIGSVLNIPYRDSSFDYVYSIGCLHHTGDIERSVSEVYRVLRNGGQAVIMLYNKYSFRLLVQVPLMRVLGIFSNMKRYKDISEKIRSLYDTSEDGSAAPHTDFVSPREVRRIFKRFSRVKIDIRNFDNYSIRGKFILKREWVLNNLARFLGLDLYIMAIK